MTALNVDAVRAIVGVYDAAVRYAEALVSTRDVHHFGRTDIEYVTALDAAYKVSGQAHRDLLVALGVACDTFDVAVDDVNEAIYAMIQSRRDMADAR